MFENEIILGNAAEKLKLFPNSSVDLTVTSPPYDNLRSYNGTIDSWNWGTFNVIVNELYRVTKDGGVVVWIVNDKTDNGSKTGTSFRQALYFQEIGFNINDVMIWRKTNPMPQVKQPRYAQCFEYMFIFSKGKPKTFNPIMRECQCGGMLYDSTAKNMDGESGRHKLKYNVNKESVDYNVWDVAVAQNKGSVKHLAVFPYELVSRHIKTWSNEGDLVLDPFIGSGTTAIAAMDLNRKFTGIELCEEYYQDCIRNINAHIA